LLGQAFAYWLHPVALYL
jgi:Pentapeptide repeats (8 copies)